MVASSLNEKPTAMQLALAEGMARLTDPETSWAAAADALQNADTNRAIALRALRAHPDGLTDFELADMTGIAQTSIGKRRGELRDQGLVEYAGIKRPAPSGSMSRVWKAVTAPATAQLFPHPVPGLRRTRREKHLRKEGDE